MSGKDVDFSDATNGLYNQKAKGIRQSKRSPSSREGVKFPIHLDIPTIQTNTLIVNGLNLLKQSIEKSLRQTILWLIFKCYPKEDVNITYYYPNACFGWDIWTNLAGLWLPSIIIWKFYIWNRRQCKISLASEAGEKTRLLNKLRHGWVWKTSRWSCSWNQT